MNTKYCKVTAAQKQQDESTATIAYKLCSCSRVIIISARLLLLHKKKQILWEMHLRELVRRNCVCHGIYDEINIPNKPYIRIFCYSSTHRLLSLSVTGNYTATNSILKF